MTQNEYEQVSAEIILRYSRPVVWVGGYCMGCAPGDEQRTARRMRRDGCRGRTRIGSECVLSAADMAALLDKARQ